MNFYWRGAIWSMLCGALLGIGVMIYFDFADWSVVSGTGLAVFVYLFLNSLINITNTFYKSKRDD